MGTASVPILPSNAPTIGCVPVNDYDKLYLYNYLKRKIKAKKKQ